MALSLIKTFETSQVKSFFEKYLGTISTFRKAKRKSSDRDYDEYNEIVNMINTTKMEWENSIQTFENMTDCDLIDSYAYQIKACELRLEYFIKIAKKKGIKNKAFS